VKAEELSVAEAIDLVKTDRLIEERIMTKRGSNVGGLATVLAILLAVALGCGGGKPVPQAYQGQWVGDDGTTITMDSEGRASFKKGGKSVDGGGAEIDEAAKTLTISLFGISETWKIDEPPADGVMTLSGTEFRKR
jgi:hypothetical protein